MKTLLGRFVKGHAISSSLPLQRAVAAKPTLVVYSFHEDKTAEKRRKYPSLLLSNNFTRPSLMANSAKGFVRVFVKKMRSGVMPPFLVSEFLSLIPEGVRIFLSEVLHSTFQTSFSLEQKQNNHRCIQQQLPLRFFGQQKSNIQAYPMQDM